MKSQKLKDLETLLQPFTLFCVRQNSDHVKCAAHFQKYMINYENDYICFHPADDSGFWLFENITDVNVIDQDDNSISIAISTPNNPDPVIIDCCQIEEESFYVADNALDILQQKNDNTMLTLNFEIANYCPECFNKNTIEGSLYFPDSFSEEEITDLIHSWDRYYDIRSAAIDDMIIWSKFETQEMIPLSALADLLDQYDEYVIDPDDKPFYFSFQKYEILCDSIRFYGHSSEWIFDYISGINQIYAPGLDDPEGIEIIQDKPGQPHTKTKVILR